MLSPLNGNEPRTRPTPASQRSSNASFEQQRAATDLRHRQEQLADERARLGEERRALARERAEFEAERDERLEQQHAEQRTEQRRTEAIEMAGDLAHDVNDAAPGYRAGLILAAAAKAKGGQSEPLTGMVAAIVRSAKLAAGEIASEPALPENATARAIVLSGRRAMGEPLAADDAEWLQGYCRKLEDARRR